MQLPDETEKQRMFIGEVDNDRIHIITQSIIALIMVLGGGSAFVYLQINNYNGGDALVGLIGAVSSYYFINGAIRQAVASTQRSQRDATSVAQQAQSMQQSNGKSG